MSLKMPYSIQQLDMTVYAYNSSSGSDTGHTYFYYDFLSSWNFDCLYEYYASSHTIPIEHPFFNVLGCTHALEFRICKGFMDYAPCIEVSWDCNSSVSTDSIVSYMPYTKITQLSLHSTLCTPAFPGDLSYGTRLGCFIIILQLKKCLTLYLKCNS